MTNVHVNPLDFALPSLAQFSFVKSTVVFISVIHSSNFVELYSLKKLCPVVMSWLGLFASVWYTRCSWTDVSLLWKVQLVYVEVVDEALLRDYVAHILCSPHFLLGVLLQPLLTGISHLSPS